MRRSTEQVSLNTTSTHLPVRGLQDPTHERGLIQGSTDLIPPNLVADHPRPRPGPIVHGDVRQIQLTGVICPEARSVYTPTLAPIEQRECLKTYSTSVTLPHTSKHAIDHQIYRLS